MRLRKYILLENYKSEDNRNRQSCKISKIFYFKSYANYIYNLVSENN